MQLKAVFAAIAAMVLGGCVGPDGAPAATGSVRPTLDASDLVKPTAKAVVEPKRSLANAVTACLDRNVPVQTPAFRRCVTETQRSAVPG